MGKFGLADIFGGKVFDLLFEGEALLFGTEGDNEGEDNGADFLDLREGRASEAFWEGVGENEGSGG